MGKPSFLRNVLTSRTAWLRKLLDPRKDIDAESGHPVTIEVSDYSYAYDRGDVARRVVNLYPEESWNQSPIVIQDENDDETEFEAAFKKLDDDHKIFHYLQRADILSGIGRFGVLLLGIDDGLELIEPVEPGEGRELLYLRPFEEHFVTVSSLEQDPSNERFGMPVLYNIQFADSANGEAPGSGTTEAKNATQVSVHYTRVLHLCDNRQNSDVYGRPRMEVVFNRLLDLRKIMGGSAEMFWKGGFPGISLEAANPDDDVEFDQEATEEQMDKYMNGLQRYITVVGMTAKSLTPQVADPSAHVEVQLKLIAIALSVPWRILVGSEQGVLASDQDSVSWNKRIDRRRIEYITPFILRPLVEKFMEIGILPTVEEFDIKWPDLNTPSDNEKADVAQKRTAAIAQYVQSGADALIPPFQYLTHVLGFAEEEATAILEEAGDRIDELTPEFKDEREESKAQADQSRKVEQAAAAGEAAAKAPAAPAVPGKPAPGKPPVK